MQSYINIINSFLPTITKTLVNTLNGKYSKTNSKSL